MISKEVFRGKKIHENEQNLLPPADSEGEIERLREVLIIERERNLRTLADFKNYRRRVERDGKKLAEEGEREIILPLLDIIDDVDKAMQWAGDGGQPAAEGLRMIHKKLFALLETNGVLPFDSVGASFNPDLHEAVTMVERGDLEPGTVVDELRRGYLWNNEVLRHAQVRVAE